MTGKMTDNPKLRIAIIDYGMGNLHSVEKALQRLCSDKAIAAETAQETIKRSETNSTDEQSFSAEIIVTSQPEKIAAADKVILPGVGAFGDCMKNIRSYGLSSVIHKVIEDGKPFLGICLGLQMLFDGSEEAPGVAGLGVFAGMVRKIAAPDLKIPHMGWNSLEYRSASPLFAGLDANPYVYFVHSFHAVPEDSSLITAITEYGGCVTAAAGRGNVQAVQFHPEKSSSVGMGMLMNFIHRM